MDNRPIAVFDSGIGSLSVIRTLRKEMPAESIVYLADRAHFPYGKKSKSQLKSIIIQTLQYLERFNPKVIIVASLTPSLQVLRECKLYTTIPIFGVYLNVGDAVALSTTKVIALLATEGTLASQELDDHIKPYITTTKIIKVNASPIIDIIESGKLDDRTIEDVLIKNTAAIRSNPKVDVIILGSTHMSLIKGNIDKVYSKMHVVDPAIATVKQVKNYLRHQNLTASEGGKMQILVSRKKEEFEKIAKAFDIEEKIEEVKLDFKVDFF